jgi:oligopeptide transport system substrate-binding protein
MDILDSRARPYRAVRALICRASVVCLLLSGLSCTSKSTAVQAILTTNDFERAETMVVAFSEGPQNLDWTLANDYLSSVIHSNIMEGLTGFDVNEAQIRVIPALAKEWTVENEGLKYIFKLRENVKWTDGEPLKAEHFIHALRRILEPSSSSPWSNQLLHIKNARDYHDGKVQDFAQVGIQAPDDLTLIITLEEPLSHLPAIMAHHSTYPIRTGLIAQFTEHWTAAGNLVTLGPYKVGQHIKNRFLTLTRNPLYKPRPAIKNIICLFNVKTADALSLYNSKQVDVVAEVPLDDQKKVKNKIELIRSPLLAISYLGFDVRNKPLNNPILRRALGMAIDREELIRVSGSLRSTAGMIPPGLLGYESNRGVRFDPEAAKTLFKKPGVFDETKYDSLEFKIFGAEYRDVADNIKAQIQKNLGVELKIVEEKSWPPGPTKNPYMFIAHWFANVPDPDDFLSIFTSKSPHNFTSWKNREYDQFVKKAANSIESFRRERFYSKAQHVLTEEDMPVIPLYTRTQFVLVSKGVKNYPVNIMRLMPFKGVAMK